jgi:polar amino acid transport system substrate-binding protein
MLASPKNTITIKLLSKGLVFMNTLSILLRQLSLSLLVIISTGVYSFTAMAETLVVGVNPFYRPLVFKENDKLVGIDPTTAKEVGKLLSRDIEFKEMEFEALIPALKAGDIDVIMSGMSVTDEREQHVDFSDSYMEIGQMAIVSMAKIGSLSYPAAIFEDGRTVGVEPGTTGESYAKEYLGTATVKTYESPKEAFAALRSGDIDYYIHDAPTSWKIGQSTENSDLMPLYRSLTKEQLAWAVKKGNTALLNDLNKALGQLKEEGKINAIQNHWIPVKVEVN